MTHNLPKYSSQTRKNTTNIPIIKLKLICLNDSYISKVEPSMQVEIMVEKMSKKMKIFNTFCLVSSPYTFSEVKYMRDNI